MEHTGNAIHHGNTILGRIAVKDGKTPGLRIPDPSGATTGSPQLDSFGPNMSLAKDLLEKGQKEAVLHYFDLRSAFWKSADLAKWRADVAQGRIPDFGANLKY